MWMASDARTGSLGVDANDLHAMGMATDPMNSYAGRDLTDTICENNSVVIDGKQHEIDCVFDEVAEAKSLVLQVSPGRETHLRVLKMKLCVRKVGHAARVSSACV